jgi:hypothetical protein
VGWERQRLQTPLTDLDQSRVLEVVEERTCEAADQQYLRIKHFYGTSDNAVKTQIWISIYVYVLVAIMKKQLESKRSLYSILQILSVNAFKKEPLHQILSNSALQNPEYASCNQLVFRY